MRQCKMGFCQGNDQTFQNVGAVQSAPNFSEGLTGAEFDGSQ